MNDMTVTETATGAFLLVELDEDTRQIVFRDGDTREAIAAYTFADFADVTDALALNLGTDTVLDAVAVAELQQWANLDAHGLKLRGE